MKISLVVATDLEGVIGNEGALPWHLPADLRRFRKLTLGKPIIMGRKTYESIGKPLAGRQNIILTRRDGYRPSGCEVASSAEEALHIARRADEIMVIGGAAVYAEFLPQAGRIYLTVVKDRFPGDTKFPPYDPGEWRETEREEHPADAKNAVPHCFKVLDRI